MTTLTREEAIEKTDDIIERYEHWWRDEQAQAEMKAIWGDAINSSGVFIDREEEVLFDKDGCRASISIGTAHGCFAFGIDLRLPLEGSSHAPSVFGEFFDSREAARTAAIQQIIGRLPKRDDDNRHKADRVREALQGMLRQPSLF